MHCSTRDMVRLLLVSLSATALADASQPQDRREAAAARNHARDVVDKRQILTLSVGVPPDPTTTGRTVPPNTEPTSASSTTTREPTTRSSPPPTSTSSSAPPPPSTTSQPPATSPSSVPTPETSTVIITATRDDGSPTTYATQTTSLPTNQPGGNTGGGMPESTKTTVIGVVVGIGGAIVLVVLGFLAWRIWGRGRQNEESDELMGYGTAGSGVGSAGYGVEKTSEAGGSSQGRTPFQSTLESYHAPTHVNPSSNF